MGAEFAEVTNEITLKRAWLWRAKQRSQEFVFVFASSCSIYGASSMGKRWKLIKPTLISLCNFKVTVEEALEVADLGGMVTTCLRFATACGWSDRLRLDLVLNDFVVGALTHNKIEILSDGSPWRPLIDVEDMARAISWAISRPKDIEGPF